MQTIDAIIVNAKIRYLDPVAIYESMHAGPKWMKDDDDHLKPFKTKEAKANERKRFHEEAMKRVAAYMTYDGTMGKHGFHICAIPRLLSLIPIIC